MRVIANLKHRNTSWVTSFVDPIIFIGRVWVRNTTAWRIAHFVLTQGTDMTGCFTIARHVNNAFVSVVPISPMVANIFLVFDFISQGWRNRISHKSSCQRPLVGHSVFKILNGKFCWHFEQKTNQLVHSGVVTYSWKMRPITNEKIQLRVTIDSW